MRAALLLAAAALAASCGGGDDGRVTIFGASSLTEVFEQLAPSARFNFAGSDELAAQIREGAPADVYASASARYPAELHAEGLVEEPRTFATNRLVLIVPSDNPAAIERLADAARAGVKVVVAAEGVPAGDYTRSLLERAGREDVLERAVSEEEDVKGVLTKVALGEADAGFVYATDARAAAARVRAIELPHSAEAPVEYAVAVVRGADHAEQGRAFVAELVGRRGRDALRAAGFGLP